MSKRKTNEEFVREVCGKNEYVRRGEVEMLSEYVGVDTKIKCRCTIHDWIYFVAPSSLLNNIGCRKCGHKRTTQKQMKSQEQFVSEVYDLDSTTTVLGIYAGAFTPIDFMCSKGHIYQMRPVDFLHGKRCPYCASRKILIGYNDIATTRPDIAALFTDKEDGYRYMAGSKYKASFTCPLCGTIQYKHIGLVSERGFSCKNCSDHLSYPNRFGRAFFDQLSVDYYDTEWQPSWAKPYYYDVHFELNGKHFVVEWDGQFHFEEEDRFGVSLEERQERDRIKNELALSNNVYMIRVNCAESKCDYIKANIMRSELSRLFDLSNIDWKLCDEKAHKNLIKEACNLYMNNTKDYDYIAKVLHIGSSTARQYIKRGISLGWCEYDNDKLKTDKKKRHGYSISATVICKEKTYNFNSMCSCIKWLKELCGVKIDHRTMSKYCKMKQPYNGVLFEFTKETIQN